MNGLDATRHLKREKPELRVIMLTIFDMEEYREAATAAGAVDFVLKKSMNGELIPAIRKAFEPKTKRLNLQ